MRNKLPVLKGEERYKLSDLIPGLGLRLWTAGTICHCVLRSKLEGGNVGENTH